LSGRGGGFLLVRTGSRRVGLELSHVIEVTEIGAVHTVPAIDPALRGVAAVHGRMVPVVHLGALLEARPCPPREGNLVVLIAVDGRHMCLEVDEAEIVVRKAPLPVPPGATLPWAIGVARLPDGLVPLLDLPLVSSRFVEAA
jgi:chemotaxis signal transduction protein